MKYAVFLLSVWMCLSSGYTVSPIYKGCFSTSFAQKYDFYYKFHQSLSLEQCTAVCNNRLTRYMGLETDESSPHYNYVFCGNDLAEVSPKTDNILCNPCLDNSSFLCGKNGTMSLYLLRDSTPLSLLLATNSGVEILSENMTTLKVSHYSTSNYKFLDYIYTEDIIISVIGSSFLRSSYNPLIMKFSPHYVFHHENNAPLSLAVDCETRHLYYSYRNKILFKGSILGTYSEVKFLEHRHSIQEQISVDPYNRSVAFLEKPYNVIYISLMDESILEYPLTHQHIEKINALSMDIHEMLLYAILTFTGDSTTYLVSLDYGLSQMRIVCSGPELENSTLLEVFHHDAVWIGNKNGVSTIYQCKLMPKCRLDTLIVLPMNQTIYDFTIFHPEKQTPGRKRLCANMTCSHGCQLFSPFTVRCTCPPGMDLKPDHSTCFWGSTRVQTVPTTSISSSHEASRSPVDSTTPIYGLRSTSQFTTQRSENHTPRNKCPCVNNNCSHSCLKSSPFTCICTCPPGMILDSDNSTCVWVNQSTQTASTTSASESHDPSRYPVGSTTGRDVFTLPPEVMMPKKNDKSGLVHNEIGLLICVFILIVLIIFSVVVFDLYRKNNRLLKLQQRHTNIMEMHLKSIENHYNM